MTTEPITLNLTLKELQQIDKYIEVNDDTLSVLMKIKNAYPDRSPIEEAYKDWWGEYPGTEIWTSNDETRWVGFQKGYEASKNNCEDISRVLIEGDDAYIMGVKYQRVAEPTKPMNEVLDKLENKYKQAEDNPKPKTIRSIIDRWWTDTFTTHSYWDAEECMDDLADQIELWILRNKNDQR
jgi:hypothetical protein